VAPKSSATGAGAGTGLLDQIPSGTGSTHSTAVPSSAGWGQHSVSFVGGSEPAVSNAGLVELFGDK
jgi:hypothetical protein